MAGQWTLIRENQDFEQEHTEGRRKESKSLKVEGLKVDEAQTSGLFFNPWMQGKIFCRKRTQRTQRKRKSNKCQNFPTFGF
jgi:hypothetical protein